MARQKNMNTNHQSKTKFSVLISVYYKDRSDFLKTALSSVLNNSFKPAQIILVKDGKLGIELENVIKEFLTKYPDVFTVVGLEKNLGLGQALNIGLQHADHELVARMDSDDICYLDRFEKQIEFLNNNPEISVLGTSVQEFNTTMNDLRQYRKLPQNSNDLRKFARFRNPLNHPSVMFRKNVILEVGSYHDMPLFEDYYLWIRILDKKFKIANLGIPLLHFRVGNDMIARRHGWSYLKKEFTFLQALHNLGYLNFCQFSTSLFIKLPLRIFPKFILAAFYKIV